MRHADAFGRPAPRGVVPPRAAYHAAVRLVHDGEPARRRRTGARSRGPAVAGLGAGHAVDRAARGGGRRAARAGARRQHRARARARPRLRSAQRLVQSPRRCEGLRARRIRTRDGRDRLAALPAARIRGRVCRGPRARGVAPAPPSSHARSSRTSSCARSCRRCRRSSSRTSCSTRSTPRWRSRARAMRQPLVENAVQHVSRGGRVRVGSTSRRCGTAIGSG